MDLKGSIFLHHPPYSIPPGWGGERLHQNWPRARFIVQNAFRHGGIRRHSSADDFGRLEEEGWRDGQAQGLGSLEVDDELKGRGLLDGEVSRLSPVEEFVHVVGEALPPLG